MLKVIRFITCLLVMNPFAVARVQELRSMKPLIMPHADTDNTKAQFANRVLPKSLTAADSSQSVVSKIIDNSLAYWWDHSDLKNTSIGQAAETVQNKMKAEISLGDAGENITDHKVSFKLLAMQALAKIEYRGWFKAAINYDAKAAAAQAEILENLSHNKDLVISQSITANENKSQLSLRWNW
jgi:hypothetical protein